MLQVIPQWTVTLRLQWDHPLKVPDKRDALFRIDVSADTQALAVSLATDRLREWYKSEIIGAEAVEQKWPAPQWEIKKAFDLSAVTGAGTEPGSS